MEAWISLFEFLTAVFMLMAAILAVIGVHSWRKEHLGRKRVDLAEDVLVAAHEAAEAIRSMRCSASLGEEHLRIERLPGASDEEHNTRVYHQFARLRYHDAREVFARLKALRHRVRVHFGEEAAGAMKEIDVIAWSVIDAGGDLLGLANASAQGSAHNGLDARRQGLEDIYSGSNTDTDPIRPRLEGALGTLDRVLGPLIRAQEVEMARWWPRVVQRLISTFGRKE